MIRKSMLALAAIATLGAAALAPTSASAWGFKASPRLGPRLPRRLGLLRHPLRRRRSGLLLRQAREPLRRRARDQGLRVIDDSRDFRKPRPRKRPGFGVARDAQRNSLRAIRDALQFRAAAFERHLGHAQLAHAIVGRARTFRSDRSVDIGVWRIDARTDIDRAERTESDQRQHKPAAPHVMPAADEGVSAVAGRAEAGSAVSDRRTANTRSAKVRAARSAELLPVTAELRTAAADTRRRIRAARWTAHPSGRAAAAARPRRRTLRRSAAPHPGRRRTAAVALLRGKFRDVAGRSGRRRQGKRGSEHESAGE